MSFPAPQLLSAADIADVAPSFVWIAAGIIVVVGLLILGFRELFRFSIIRVTAIAGVCFRESIRRRVLWVIPLAALGVIVVSQLQKVTDEQDAVRQTTKFCLFTTGLVVTLSSVILACTNLPREIENRVIYTIVTKPTTRLELIVGKILGFSSVSLMILVIMGVFTYAYLGIRSWQQLQGVNARLATDPLLTPVERNTLKHYADAGLLTAKSYARPDDVQIMATQDAAPTAPASAAAAIPNEGDLFRSIYGDSEEEFLLPFTVDRQRMFANPSNPAGVDNKGGMGGTGALIGVRVLWHRYGPENSMVNANPNAAVAQQKSLSAPAQVSVDILDASKYSLVSSYVMYDVQRPTTKDASAGGIALPPENQTDHAGPTAQSKMVWAYIPPVQAGAIFNQPIIYVHIVGPSHNVQYYADPSSAIIMISPPVTNGLRVPDFNANTTADSQWFTPDNGPDGHPIPPEVRGRLASRGGQELAARSPKDGRAPIALFHFRGDALLAADYSQPVPLELSFNIERGGDTEAQTDAVTSANFWVRPAGAKNAALSDPVELKLENKQTVFAAIPASSTGGGDFDILLRCNSPGHVLDIQDASLGLVVGQEFFAWNLIKSLFIMWLLTVLVVTLAILSSTFVSWPIAVVLTVVLLLGHWAVTQVADASDNTLGRQMATNMGMTDASKMEAVAAGVNALTGSLQYVGSLLPDIDRFSAISDLESGMVVSRKSIVEALGVLLCFGLPATVLGFVILKHKEVAP
jgi:ABC-type transport system involved in multi-copper enzyme maturation permease subunit